MSAQKHMLATDVGYIVIDSGMLFKNLKLKFIIYNLVEILDF